MNHVMTLIKFYFLFSIHPTFKSLFLPCNVFDNISMKKIKEMIFIFQDGVNLFLIRRNFNSACKKLRKAHQKINERIQNFSFFFRRLKTQISHSHFNCIVNVVEASRKFFSCYCRGIKIKFNIFREKEIKIENI